MTDPAKIDAPPDTLAPPGPPAIPAVSLLTICSIFFPIGALGFGGGLVGWLYRDIVERRKWMQDSEFLSMVTLGQVLPGINMANFAIYVGQKLRGIPGAAVALVSLLVVPFFFVIGLAAIYTQIQAYILVQHFLGGVATAAVGLLMSVMVKSGKKTMRQVAPAVIVVGIVITVGFLRWPMASVVLVAAPISVAIAWFTREPDHA